MNQEFAERFLHSDGSPSKMATLGKVVRKLIGRCPGFRVDIYVPPERLPLKFRPVDLRNYYGWTEEEECWFLSSLRTHREFQELLQNVIEEQIIMCPPGIFDDQMSPALRDHFSKQRDERDRLEREREQRKQEDIESIAAKKREREERQRQAPLLVEMMQKHRSDRPLRLYLQSTPVGTAKIADVFVWLNVNAAIHADISWSEAFPWTKDVMGHGVQEKPVLVLVNEDPCSFRLASQKKLRVMASYDFPIYKELYHFLPASMADIVAQYACGIPEWSHSKRKPRKRSDTCGTSDAKKPRKRLDTCETPVKPGNRKKPRKRLGKKS